MVTDALWSDYDNDNDPDLILVGEFMPITIFTNNDGRLVKQQVSGLDKTGLWNSIYPGDFDKDGDIDYIAGNSGINNFYCATPETPLTIIAKDFDNNGDIDAIMSCYFKAEDGTMQPFPVQSWQQLSKQSPIFRKRFSSYNEFGLTTIDQLLSPEEREGAVEVKADYLHSSYIENLGDGSFEIRPLPVQAQVAPVNGISTGDFNNDGNLDVLLVGNDYGNEVNMGQYDAMIGVVLLGDGSGTFESASVLETGFMVDGDAKALARITISGKPVYLATQNRGKLLAYTMGSEQQMVKTQPTDFRAIFTYGDGRTEVVDIPYGSAFMTQSGRDIVVPANVTQVEIVNFQGEKRTVDLVIP